MEWDREIETDSIVVDVYICGVCNHTVDKLREVKPMTDGPISDTGVTP